MIEEKLAHKDITWKFNPPAAPHFDSAWERLVKFCTRAVFEILEARSLPDEILNTTACLVEQTLNTRTLTPVSYDPNALEALTPNQFLLGRSNIAVPFLPSPQRYNDVRRSV